MLDVPVEPASLLPVELESMLLVPVEPASLLPVELEPMSLEPLVPEEPVPEVSLDDDPVPVALLWSEELLWFGSEAVL